MALRPAAAWFFNFIQKLVRRAWAHEASGGCLGHGRGAGRGLAVGVDANANVGGMDGHRQAADCVIPAAGGTQIAAKWTE